MVKSESKLVKVNVEDWEVLNKLLGILQSQRRERQSLADVVHWLIQTSLTVLMNSMSEWMQSVIEALPKEFRKELEAQLEKAGQK